MEQHAPLLIVLSGPSGVGKDTLIQALRKEFREIHYTVTATTRPPRPGEVDGENYIFLSQLEYDRMLDNGKLLAPAEVHSYWYGAPLDQVRTALNAGKDVLLKIDVQGALQVRRRLPQAVFIFLAPPSLLELLDRMRARHTESETELERRMRDAHFEMSQMPHYDYAVVNRDDDLAEAVLKVGCIIRAERLRLHRQPIELENH